jgi:hypothetical protein
MEVSFWKMDTAQTSTRPGDTQKPRNTFAEQRKMRALGAAGLGAAMWELQVSCYLLLLVLPPIVFSNKQVFLQPECSSKYLKDSMFRKQL